RDLTDEQIMEISLIENLQREDLNPIEEAQAYQKLMKQFDMTQDQLAQKVSKSRTLIANTVRLLKLDDVIQQMIIDKRLSSGHARALLGLDDQLDIYETAQKVINEALSVRQTEDLVRMINEKKSLPVKETNKEEESEQIKLIYAKYEETLRDIIGTKVNIKRKKNQKGKIEIEYYNLDDLDRIFALLGTLNKQEA
ncbi:MAG: ParB/RepB/Spo0J family partition protein, partial [Lachnospiraceae bacterium]